MGFTEWIGQATRWFRNSGPNTITTSQELAQVLRGWGMDSLSGVPVSVELAASLSAIQVCERVLTSDLSQLPLILYLKTGNKSEQAKAGPRANLYQVLAARSNEFLTSYQFRKTMWRDWFYRGNAYARIVRGFAGDVLALHRLHPDGVTVNQDENGKITYEFHKPNGQPIIYQKKDIFHFWDTSDDGIIGLDPIRAHRESIGDAHAIRQHGSTFFKNKAMMGGLLEMVAGTRLGPEAAKALLSDFDEVYSGSENAHKTAILPGGVTFKPVSINMQDAQWLETRKKTDRDIYGIYGVPPHKGGDLDQAAVRANVEHENISYVQNSLMPRAICFEQCLMRDLLDNDESYEVRHNFSGLFRGDAAGRASFYTAMVGIRAMTPNEVREKEEMNPLDGGDEFPEVKPSPPPPPPQEPANAPR